MSWQDAVRPVSISFDREAELATTVVTVSGEIDLRLHGQLREVLNHEVDAGQHLILDLTHVDFLVINRNGDNTPRATREAWVEIHNPTVDATDLTGWTIRSADGSRGAHVEHTVALTDGDPIVLTARD